MGYNGEGAGVVAAIGALYAIYSLSKLALDGEEMASQLSIRNVAGWSTLISLGENPLFSLASVSFFLNLPNALCPYLLKIEVLGLNVVHALKLKLLFKSPTEVFEELTHQVQEKDSLASELHVRHVAIEQLLKNYSKLPCLQVGRAGPRSHLPINN